VQQLSTAVIFDLEFTAWPGSLQRRWSAPGEFREIVQIGAVLVLPADNYIETAHFCRLVRPRRNPVLSRYFIELTGITQEAVDRSGEEFNRVLADFAAFAGETAPLISNGADGAVVLENCRLLGLTCPIPPARFQDIGPSLAAVLGCRGHVTSGDLPRLVAGVPALPAHDALADARMITAAVRRLTADGHAILSRPCRA